MAYLDSEISQHKGKPTELYKFEGTYKNFFYTSGPKKVRFPDTPQGDTYLPIAMRRSEINCGTQEDDGLDLTITMSVQNEIVKVYGFQSSPPKLNLTLIRFHDINEPVEYWNGPVNDIQVSNGIATLRSPSMFAAAMAANFPSVFFQSPCNNVLYDKRCKVKFEDFSMATAVIALDNRAITVNSVGTLDGKLIGGEVALASGERRMIVSQDAKLIMVNFPFSGMKVGDAVTIAAGCDLAYKGDCKVKFNNNRNFGGFPFIPNDNPFQNGINPSIVPLEDNTCLPDITGSWYVELVWTQPMIPGNFPALYNTNLPQPSGVFPNGAYMSAGTPINRINLQPDNGSAFVIQDLDNGWNILDFGANPAIIMQFRYIYSGASIVGYRWDFFFEIDREVNKAIAWGHQIQRAGFPSGDDFPATLNVGTGSGVIATSPTIVYRTFPADYSINY